MKKLNKMTEQLVMAKGKERNQNRKRIQDWVGAEGDLILGNGDWVGSHQGGTVRINPGIGYVFDTGYSFHDDYQIPLRRVCISDDLIKGMLICPFGDRIYGEIRRMP